MFIINYKRNLKDIFIFKNHKLQKNLLFKFLYNLDLTRLNYIYLFSKNKYIYVNSLEFLKKSGLV